MTTTDTTWHTDAQTFDFSEKVERLAMRGDPAIWEQITSGAPGLALLSSSRAPAGVLLQIHDWARHWRQHGPIVISGFQSEVENEALHVLLGGTQPIVQLLARGMRQRLPPAQNRALAGGRLLLVSPFPDSVGWVSAAQAQVRNRLVCALAQTVLIAHAEPGSKTLSLLDELMAGSKALYTIDHPANRPLLDRGIPAYSHL